MSDRDDERKQMSAPNHSLPVETRWVRKAAGVTGPVSAFTFGIAARANMRAMQNAMAHAKVFGQLMEVTADTLGKIEHAQNAALVQGARQHLAGELFDGEIERQRAKVEEERHQRLLAEARRDREILEAEKSKLEAETRKLDAKHSLEAIKKFKPLKFKLGRARTEARQKDAEADKAAAEAAASELGQKTRKATGSDESAVAAWLNERISALQDQIKNGEADGTDTTKLRADLDALMRLKSAM